jgi:hypothetical protein
MQTTTKTRKIPAAAAVEISGAFNSILVAEMMLRDIAQGSDQWRTTDRSEAIARWNANRADAVSRLAVHGVIVHV